VANNGEMIINLDKKRMLAMATKDIAALDALLADDLVYTHSTARLDTKQSLMGSCTRPGKGA
jgi:ketosteroid isomerase-like protein